MARTSADLPASGEVAAVGLISAALRARELDPGSRPLQPGARFRPDHTTARADIFDFLETFHNRRRLRKHIHWGYLTPHETRPRYPQDQALAA